MTTILKALTVGGAMILTTAAINIAQAQDGLVQQEGTEQTREQFPATAAPQEVHRLTYTPAQFL